MIFHSWQFGVFLAITLTLYWLLANHRGVRLSLLLVASLIFFGSYEPWFVGLLVFSAILDFACGNVIARGDSRRRRLVGLLASLLGNLGVLCYFKYSLWIAEVFDPLFASAGIPITLMPIAWTDVVPVGISFYTFQTLSYTIDIYRGVLKPVKSLRDFSLFVSFFPQLVAGPIVRAIDFLPQLDLKPRFDRQRFHDGLYRIGVGLAKKSLISDQLGAYIVDPVYHNPSAFGPWAHLMAIYAFSFQIYCDFSGYSDIAIGTARLFGFDLLENFVTPFQSKSVREFWRRWHISLGSWVRDYVYFPLGGSQRSELRVSYNLWTTMIIIGLWHGASSLWIVYGFLQGSAMVLERQLQRWRGGGEFTTTWPRKLLSWFLCFQFVAVTLLFVRSTSWAELQGVLLDYGEGGFDIFDAFGYVALGLAVATHFLPANVSAGFQRRVVGMPTWAVGVLMGIIIGAVFIFTVGETPFIYFQF